MNTPHPSAPTWARSPHHATAGLNTAAMAALLALVLLATLVRGGNRHVAMLGLEWLALAALLAMAWGWLIGSTGTDSRGHHAGTPGGTTPATAWAWGLLLTAPLWLAAWAGLPVWQGWRPALAVPDATWGTTLLGLPLLACLVAGRWGSDAQVSALARAWLWVALLQAVWGLLQVAGLDSLLFGQASGGVAIGSFANRNNFSNLLVMALPWAVWRIATHRHPARSHGQRRTPGPMGLAPQGWGWLVGLLLMLSLLFLARSRAGIVTGLLVLMLALPLLLGQRNGRHDTARPLGRRWLLAGAAALLGLALLAAGWEWLARFEPEHLLASGAGRALMRQTTWQAALAHWPWGSGLGSYASVYPAWQPAEFGRHLIDLAHNDYLQLFMELGLAFVPLAGTVLWLLGHQLWQMWRQPAPHGHAARNRRHLRVAAGLGLLATALHAWVDYPFHIPANAMMACFLLGVVLRPVK